MLFFFSNNAHAYLDPGTGSYILQLVIAAICFGYITLQIFWKKITVFFTNLFSKKNKSTNNDKK